MKAKISVIGLGPGGLDDMTSKAKAVISNSKIIVGYNYYIPFIESLIGADTEILQNGMRQEQDRIMKAFEIAESGKDVTVISSGDAGIYGMAPLVYETLKERGADIEVEVVPGISAFQKAASLLGAPVGHDFCVISLSDLMTPWDIIEKRIKAAAEADFVTAVYNPKSHGRYWEIYRMKELFLEFRNSETPVGYVRQAGREGQKVTITTLQDFDPEDIDMFTVVVIGNSQTYTFEEHIVTPRGYYVSESKGMTGLGQSIMVKSFRTIERELKNPNLPLGRKWQDFCTLFIPRLISRWRI